jgi:predicted O-methyltransferase YrrM
MGFENSCIPEVGRLLSVLAAAVRGGSIGEVGTGCGVGATWLVSGLAADSRFVTVEEDGERAASVAALFQHRPNVRVLHGDWHDILAHEPFDLLFVDAAPAKYDEPAVVVESLRIGGLVVLDDLTPEEYWPPSGAVDPMPCASFGLTMNG